MQNSLAWKNGSWLPIEDATIAMDDIGFLQGAVVVDRLRTIAGTALDIAQHVQRFQQNCLLLGIELPQATHLPSLVEECVQLNLSRIAEPDFSVAMLATPGRTGTLQGRPTLIVHPMAIAWARLAAWYRDGQRLKIASHRNVPSDCWSPHIKTRCRLHYYLADRECSLRGVEPNAAGVMLSSAGFITETSAANLLIVEGQTIVSPKPDSILWGISLQRTLRLAVSAGYHLEFVNVSVERASHADAILLCGSTACLWTASRFGDRTYELATEQPVYTRLLRGWTEELGFDFVSQALQQPPDL